MRVLYSLHVGKKYRLEHRYGLQNVTLTTTFCYKVFLKYTFMKQYLEMNLLVPFSHLTTQHIKIYL